MRKYKSGFKNHISLLILVLIFCLSIGYAVINRTLNISGNSEIEKNIWDVHFDNLKVTPGSIEAENAPTIDNSKLSINFDFMLNLPGDFYEFTVDVVNGGTIDAMIDSITKTPILTGSLSDYFNYIIEYENGGRIQSKQLVAKESFVRLKVRVEYKKDILASYLPTVTKTLNLGFTVNYVQADSTGISVLNNGAWVVKANGSLDDIGTIVTIGDQQFYTIGTEGDNVKLLSMYNLYVGNQFDKDNGVVPLVNPTGKQSEIARGLFDGYSADNPIIGGTVFSSKSQKGTKYSDYNGSIVEGYVNNYKIMLENDYDVDIVEARLITKEDLTSEEIGCSEEDYTCIDAPSFIYTTSYWSGSAVDSFMVWSVRSNGGFRNTAYYDNFSDLGVRPVIVLKKSDISIRELIEFTVYENPKTITYQAEEGMTWGEWIGSEYNTGRYNIDDDDNVIIDSHISTFLNDINVKYSDIIIDGVQYVNKVVSPPPI